MHIVAVDLLGAIAGGFLGATLGALMAFVFTGFAVLFGISALLGSGNPAFLNTFAFGSFFGPHVSFAAGVGAAAYAYRRGWLPSGRDIGVPLITLGRPSVLIVGGAFGLFGYLLQQVVLVIPWFGGHTDSIAITVLLMALFSRLAFGRSGIIGGHSDGFTGLKRFGPTDKHVWLAYQQAPVMATTMGLFLGGLSAWASVTLLKAYPDAPGVIYLGFGVSTALLIFLALGQQVPVTHHITIIPAVAVSIFAASLSGHPIILVLIGAAAGGVAGIVGELFSRFWLIRGDTHIDPPASTIWLLTSVLWLVGIAVGAA